LIAAGDEEEADDQRLKNRPRCKDICLLGIAPVVSLFSFSPLMGTDLLCIAFGMPRRRQNVVVSELILSLIGLHWQPATASFRFPPQLNDNFTRLLGCVPKVCSKMVCMTERRFAVVPVQPAPQRCYYMGTSYRASSRRFLWIASSGAKSWL
jgi:hypothetical protein